MKLPFATATVTIIRRYETINATTNRTVVTYGNITLHDCSWRHVISKTRTDTIDTVGDSIICRVPSDQTMPRVGDGLVFGTYSGTVTSEADFNAIISAHRLTGGACVVSSVSDNATDGLFPHYKAVGA